MASPSQPNKHEIGVILSKLKSLPHNKQCFDCGSTNPTWASVTYGVFLCIDCSAVHRSLGVHLSFIRSTQLDTNWTWIQLRAMQVGGNQNATAFFNQHNCHTTDAQEKYKSRAAQLYRAKLEKLALDAVRMNGTKLFLDAQEEKESPVPKEADFFKEHTDESKYDNLDGTSLSLDKLSTTNQKVQEPKIGPSVDSLLSSSESGLAPVRSEMKKKGNRSGAKKGGFGAAKVKADFSAIEQAAEIADAKKEHQAKLSAKTEQEEAEKEQQRLASLRLAYKDIAEDCQKQEEALQTKDVVRAKQIERLGMAKIGPGKKLISHSAFSDVQKIEQEDVETSIRPSPVISSNMDPFLSSGFSGPESTGFSSLYSNGDDLFARKQDSLLNSSRTREKSKGLDWERDIDFGDRDVKRSSESGDFRSRESDRLDSFKFTSSKNDQVKPSNDFIKKFANASSISSDAYFGRDESESENLSRFQGSSSISSDDYFGRPKQAPSFVSNELQNIKDGVRQGVTKVAGRLSTLANDMVHTLQDRFG